MLALEWFIRNSDIASKTLPIHPQPKGLGWEKTKSALLAFAHSRDDDDGIVGLLAEEDLLVCSAFGRRVTAKGYARYEELRRKSVDSSRAFVAMWFGEGMDEVYDGAIAPAIRDAGYEPVRVDRVDHIGKIDDEIIAQIRRARFVVADFTAAERDKPRGGVYYEAGFAHGLGREVVYTCREDFVDALHFDTRQFNHLTWSADKLAEFRKALRDRIESAIGRGPKADDD